MRILTTVEIVFDSLAVMQGRVYQKTPLYSFTANTQDSYTFAMMITCKLIKIFATSKPLNQIILIRTKQ